MAPHLSPNDRERIFALKLSGYRIADIHRLTGITRQTIYLWLKRWEECGDITAHRRNFYQRSTTAPQDADIVAAHAADPNLSPKIMSNKYRISVNTVRRRIKEASRNVTPRSEGDGINIAPIVSIEESPVGLQKEKLNSCIQTHVYGLNSQFIRVTNLLAQDVTKSNLLAIKRLEKALSAIETPSQAKAFAVAKLQSTKKKRKVQPKSGVRRKEIDIRKLKLPSKSPTVGVNIAANEDVKLKRLAAIRKIRNFRSLKEVAMPTPQTWQ